MSKKIIEMRGIVKTYYQGSPNELEILHGNDLDVHEGEFLSIVGASGSDKSTLGSGMTGSVTKTMDKIGGKNIMVSLSPKNYDTQSTLQEEDLITQDELDGDRCLFWLLSRQ